MNTNSTYREQTRATGETSAAGLPTTAARLRSYMHMLKAVRGDVLASSFHEAPVGSFHHHDNDSRQPSKPLVSPPVARSPPRPLSERSSVPFGGESSFAMLAAKLQHDSRRSAEQSASSFHDTTRRVAAVAAMDRSATAGEERRTLLLARATFPHLAFEAPLVDAPSFVLQISDFEQTGAALTGYILQQAKIRFPHQCRRYQLERGAGVLSSDFLLYCAGPGDVHDVADAESRGCFLNPTASIHRAPAVSTVVRAGEAATSGIAMSVRRTLLAARALQPVTAATGPLNPVLGSCGDIASHLFDLELFVFERNRVSGC